MIQVRRADVDMSSTSEAKVALFRSLFMGREDVYALRWESARTGKSGWSPAVVGGWANAKKPGREYLRLSDEVVALPSRRREPRGSVPAPPW